MNDFQQEVAARIAENSNNAELRQSAATFLLASTIPKYSYNFSWQGRPIIQYPQDMVAMQEIIWRVQPDLIIECGVAHGGSLILSASMLAVNEYARASATGVVLDTARPASQVIGIDIDIRAHNRAAIEAHPLSGLITLIEGSSVAPEVIAQVRDLAINALHLRLEISPAKADHQRALVR